MVVDTELVVTMDVVVIPIVLDVVVSWLLVVVEGIMLEVVVAGKLVVVDERTLEVVVGLTLVVDGSTEVVQLGQYGSANTCDAGTITTHSARTVKQMIFFIAPLLKKSDYP